jgi:hypothetical protein
LRAQLAANTRKMDFGDGSWRSIAKKTMEAYLCFASRTDAVLLQHEERRG